MVWRKHCCVYGFPPPTRWSTQRSNHRYIDHLGGQLTMDVPTYWAALKAGISTVQSGRVPNCECSIEICSWMCHCLFLSTLHPGILSAELGTVTSWIRMTSVTSDPSILCSDCRSKHVWQLELVDLCKCPVGRADKTAGFGDAWGEWGGKWVSRVSRVSSYTADPPTQCTAFKTTPHFGDHNYCNHDSRKWRHAIDSINLYVFWLLQFQLFGAREITLKKQFKQERRSECGRLFKMEKKGT